jgi:hypothetical protein
VDKPCINLKFFLKQQFSSRQTQIVKNSCSQFFLLLKRECLQPTVEGDTMKSKKKMPAKKDGDDKGKKY